MTSTRTRTYIKAQEKQNKKDKEEKRIRHRIRKIRE